MPSESDPLQLPVQLALESTEVNEFQSGHLLGMDPENKPRPFRRRRVYIIAICSALLLMSVGMERVYNYSVSRGANRPASDDHSLSTLSILPTYSSAHPPQQTSYTILPLTPPASSTPPVSSTPPSPPPVTSWAYLVGNVKTGQIYMTKNITEVLPIASISKLTAALVARQFMDQNEPVPITQQVMDVYSDAYGLKLGEQFPVSQMYYPMLLQSNDNAAEALAFAYDPPANETSMSTAITAVDTSTTTPTASTPAPAVASSTDTAFVEKMNAYVAELGMEHSHFLDVSGLSDGNVSTAADLFTLAQFMYADAYTTPAHANENQRPNILAVTTLPAMFVATTSEHDAHDFVNINPFVGNLSFVGGKTGRTVAAGETMLSIFKYQVTVRGQTTTYPLVVIVLHSDYGTRQADTDQLLADVESGIKTGKY